MSTWCPGGRRTVSRASSGRAPNTHPTQSPSPRGTRSRRRCARARYRIQIVNNPSISALWAADGPIENRRARPLHPRRVGAWSTRIGTLRRNAWKWWKNSRYPKTSGRDADREIGKEAHCMPGPGTRIDRFVIERLLGRGGMAEVYAARDTHLRRLVALKLLRSDRDDSAATARLLREARAASSFQHPGAVVVYDVFEHEGSAYMAMELVSGRTLRSYV